MSRDRATGIISLIIGIAVMIYSFTLPVIEGDIGLAAFPRIAAIILIACGILLCVSNNTMAPFFDTKDQWRRFVVISLLYIAYGIAMWAVGFIISSLVACFVFSKLMSGTRKISSLKIGVYTILVVGIVYLSFTKLLGMQLPSGLLFQNVF